MITIRFLSGDQVAFDAKSYPDLIDQITDHINLESNYSISLFDEEENEVSKTEPLTKTYYMALVRRRRLLEWIDPNLLDWVHLARKSYAFDYIKENLLHSPFFGNDHWRALSMNPMAIEVLRENLHRVHWESLAANPSREAFDLMEEHLDRVDWGAVRINTNPYKKVFMEKHKNLFESGQVVKVIDLNVETDHPLSERIHLGMIAEMSSNIDLIRQNLPKISLWCLARNTCPEIFPLFEELWDKFENHWDLSKNPVTWPLLKKTPERIIIRGLAYNTHPEALEYLFTSEQGKKELETDSALWLSLSMNPVAVPFLEKHKDKIDYMHLSMNPGIFC